MAKYAPQYDLFKIVLKLNKAYIIIIWLVFSLSIILFAVDQLNWNKKICQQIVSGVEISNILFLIIGFIVSTVKDFFVYPKAEEKRRRDFIDNSLNTNFSFKNSEAYFTNDEITPGIYKIGVNLFQNVFFTCSISKKMQPKAIIRTSVFIIAFILMAVHGLKNSPIALPVLQLFFSAYILGDLIKLLLFINRNESILDSLQTMFDNKLIDTIVIKNYILYEANLAWALILLDNKVFKKYNDNLESEWQQIKQKYNIK